jgi:hypothetical protein
MMTSQHCSMLSPIRTAVTSARNPAGEWVHIQDVPDETRKVVVGEDRWLNLKANSVGMIKKPAPDAVN